MTDTMTKGASNAKIWQTPELVTLDCGLGGIQNVPSGGPVDTGIFSETSGAI
jgi:hypothetical protein